MISSAAGQLARLNGLFAGETKGPPGVVGSISSGSLQKSDGKKRTIEFWWFDRLKRCLL